MAAICADCGTVAVGRSRMGGPVLLVRLSCSSRIFRPLLICCFGCPGACRIIAFPGRGIYLTFIALAFLFCFGRNIEIVDYYTVFRASSIR
jgi:hypothetical protein